jgi:hypothetical protein
MYIFFVVTRLIYIQVHSPDHVIDTCYMGNATSKFTWVSDLNKYLLNSHFYARKYNYCLLITSFRRFYFTLIITRTADLGEVSSFLCRIRPCFCSSRSYTDWSSQSHIATDCQSVSRSWCRAPSGAHDKIFTTL